MEIRNKNVLIVSPARLGDTLFCTPALRFLHQKGNVNLGIIAQTDLAHQVLSHNPYIHELMPVPDEGGLARLREQYDLTLNLHPSPRASEIYENLHLPLLPPPPPDPSLHSAERLLRFVAQLLGEPINDFERHYDLFPQTQDDQHVQQLLLNCNIDLKKHKLIGLHLGCHGLAKKHTRFWRRDQHEKAWPLKNFIKLYHLLKKTDDSIRCVLTGSKAEYALAEKFIKKCPYSINLVNQTSVLELSALMQYFCVFITGDTGPMHVACASRANMIALFGPTSLVQTGPYPKYPNFSIMQSDALKKILPVEVFSHIKI